MVKYVTSMQEFQTLKGGDKLLVVDFTASWCGPCRFVAPHFEKMAEDNPDVVFIKVDVDDADEIAGAEGIQAMPTFKFFKKGAELAMIQGANVPALTEKVAALK